MKKRSLSSSKKERSMVGGKRNSSTRSKKRGLTNGHRKTYRTNRPAQGKGWQSELDGVQVLSALTALKKGDFSARLPLEWTGLAGKVADTFNEIVELNQRMATELERI